MAEVRIRGSSDDGLICEGDIYEEFDLMDGGPGYLAFSDGTVIQARYDDSGFWRLVRLAEGTATFAKTEATDPDDDYSDRVTLTGDIRWVVFGERMERARR